MSDKFDSLRARVLYTRADPDETVGSSSEGIGWAGLYMNWERQGGYILEEDPQGFVTLQTHKTDEALQAAWEHITSELELSGEPQDDDYVIEVPANGRYRVTPLKKEFDTWEEAITAIKEDMKSSNFYPNVWGLNERGNFMLLDPTDL